MHVHKTAFAVCGIWFVLSLFLILPLGASAGAAALPGQELLAKAQAAWEKGDWETALNLCDECLGVNRQDRDAVLLKGQIYLQMKNHTMAVTCIDEYLKMDPKNAVVWVNRGTSLYELERYREMQDSFDKARSLDPSCQALYKGMGIVSFLMGNFEESYRAFLRLRELGETSPYLALSRRMLRITDPAQAPPEGWKVNLDSYQTVLDLSDASKTGYLVNITSIQGTAVRFGGSPKAPFRYAPNFEVWDGAMIFDRKGEGLLANGTHFRYKKITGDTLAVEEGTFGGWRRNLISKKIFLISP